MDFFLWRGFSTPLERGFLYFVGAGPVLFYYLVFRVSFLYSGDQSPHPCWGAVCTPQTPSRFEKWPPLLPSARRTLRFEHDGPSAPCDGASTLRLRRKNKQLPVVCSGLRWFWVVSADRRFACVVVALLLPALFNTVRLYRFILVASALQRTPELQRGLVLLLC